MGRLPDGTGAVLDCLSETVPGFRARLVHEGWSIESRRRRNRNYVLGSAEGPGYFVKCGDSPDRAHTLSREAAVLLHLNGQAGDPPLAPRRVAWDAERATLVTVLLPEAVPLTEAYGPGGRFRKPVAADLGRALSVLHATPPPDIAPFERPWVLSIHRPGSFQLAEFSGAMHVFVSLLQRQPEIGRALDGLAEGWRDSAFVHGDLKLDNIVLTRPRKRAARHVVLTDWETAGPGDPRADVGAVFAQYLQMWVQSISNTRAVAGGGTTARTRYAIERLRPSVQAFYGAYRARSGWGQAELAASVRFAGARLIQFLYELHRTTHEFHDQSVLQLQLAANLLTQPEMAADTLLGLA